MRYFLLLLPLISIPSKAITWKEFWEPIEPRIYYREPICTRIVYREEYVSGNRWNPGYVRHWRETIRVPCWNSY